MEEIKVSDTGETIAFYAYLSSDHISPATGRTGFTVDYFLRNGSRTLMTTPTVTEKDSTNMEGWYTLAIDEAGMVSAAGVLSVDIKASGMDNVPIKVLIIGNTTKEVYDVVAHTDYGNAKLVRSTTPANTLDINATHEAEVDVLRISGDAAAADNLENDYDGTGYAKANSTIGTCTANTDMVGTNSAALASVCTEGRLSELDAANIPTDLSNIEGDTQDIQTKIGVAGVGLTNLGGMSSAMQAEVQNEATDALIAQNLDHLVKSAVDTNFATTVHLDSVVGQMVDVGSSATYDRTTDSNEAIRVRGDSSWITGGGGSIADILNVQPLVPNAIDLADTATVRISLGLTNMVDDLPSTAEITPGTITIDRKAIGGTTWTNVVSAAACLELAGLIYYDEVFDSGTGYAAGDTIRITFKSQKITVSANDFEITGTDGWVFHTFIREAMVGTDSAALATALATAQADLDTITGADGVTLATAQALYAPNVVVPDVAGTATGLIAGLNDITVADIIAGVADGSYDLQEMMRLIFSACCLKVSGGGTTTVTTRDSADSKDRIVGTVDSNGNRTGLVLDGT